MKLDIFSLPLDRIYQFNDNSYIVSTMLTETRGGKYKLKEAKKFTEVYEYDGKNVVLVASGEIVLNPRMYGNYDYLFAIYDYEKNDNYNFEITMPLWDVTDDIMHFINNNKTKKKNINI